MTKENIINAVLAGIVIVFLAIIVAKPVGVDVVNLTEPTPAAPTVGAVSGPDVYSHLNVHGELGFRDKTVSIAKTSVYSTTTLTLADSGTTYYHSASGTTVTLPSVADGANFRFVVGAAVDSGNIIIDSSEGDNIEGTLIVAGAVVDCAAEDQIDFVTDGENVGDYVELRSNGTSWFIGDSGALTAAKLTCTDPS